MTQYFMRAYSCSRWVEVELNKTKDHKGSLWWLQTANSTSQGGVQRLWPLETSCDFVAICTHSKRLCTIRKLYSSLLARAWFELLTVNTSTRDLLIQGLIRYTK